MKTFLKDYVELCKEAGRFCKKHWKGAILFNVAVIGAEFAWFKYNSKMLKNLTASSGNKKEEAQQ